MHFTQGQTLSQDVADYNHVITKDQATSALWLDLQNRRLTGSTFATILNQHEQTNPIRILSYKPFTAIPAIRWGREKEDWARHHYIVYRSQQGSRASKLAHLASH